MTNTQARRVVITGFGAVTPLGNTAQESWESIQAGRLGYKIVDLPGSNINAKFFGIVDKEPNIKFLPAAIRRRLPRYARLTLGAAREAIEQAFGEGKGPADFYDPKRCGVITGSGWNGLDENGAEAVDYEGNKMCSPFACFGAMNSMSTAACSQFWQLRGYQNSISAACATGAICIGDAFEVIRHGRADMMLAGAGESLRSPFAVWSVDVIGALTNEASDATKASCPFSADRSGFVLSEGAAVLVLEEREAAIRRGATIYGEVTGYANYSDAFDITMPAEDCVARVAAIQDALAQAGLKPEDLDYINAHGTSTQLNDYNETLALKTALGDAAYKIPTSSTKSYSGHLIAAAGSFEAIICLQAMRDGLAPATANLKHHDPKCDLDFIAEGHRKMPIQRTLTMSFGFGGANASLVLERV